ncbi:MAG: RNA pseudouridine synthase, partial [Sphingomonadales bacterium]
MARRKILSDEEIQSRLLYRDGLILIVDKPAGLPVHKGPSGGSSLEDSFDALRFGLPKAPALAHRLDTDTSGCLVLGRHAKALRKLGKIFSSGEVQKTYWAVVHGKMPKASGVINASLVKRSSKAKGWR